MRQLEWKIIPRVWLSSNITNIVSYIATLDSHVFDDSLLETSRYISNDVLLYIHYPTKTYTSSNFLYSESGVRQN